MAHASLDGMVLVPGPNLRYFTGVNSFLLERLFVLLVPSEGEPRLIAPEIESGPYRRSATAMEIYSWTDSQGPDSALRKGAAAVRGGSRWGIEGRSPYLYLSRLLKIARIRPEDGEPLLQGLREVKDKAEVRTLKKSSKILSEAFMEIPGMLHEGMTEIELAKSVADVIYSKGASQVDDLLVQSGPRGADSHSGPSSRRIMRGEPLVMDLGSSLDGYHSDITRTFCVGSPRRFEKEYGSVAQANDLAREAAVEGAEVGDVDGAARRSLAADGLGERFTHRTGHGLGLEVHEAPYIIPGGKEKLRNGMFFTVEPGVYFPGKMGVRIEDDLTIEGGRSVTITDIPRELGWWR